MPNVSVSNLRELIAETQEITRAQREGIQEIVRLIVASRKAIAESRRALVRADSAIAIAPAMPATCSGQRGVSMP